MPQGRGAIATVKIHMDFLRWRSAAYTTQIMPRQRHATYNSAHGCSEIGLKWFLFAFHDLGAALGFVSVLDFSGDFVFLERRRNGKTELKPFLTILGTCMRAKSFVTIDVLFNIALRGLKFQFVTKSVVKKNSCEVLSARC
jgi:hypothetical protein